jgi:Amt family ammonium transporter
MFGEKAGWEQFLNQMIGVAVCAAAAFGSALILFVILKKTIGLRVSRKHEEQGLDSHEHGIRGYTITYE